MNTANQTRFKEALTAAYAELFKTPDYAFAAARNTPEALADKMTASLAAGTGNKDGEGIKRACKVCGIKYTYTAITAFLCNV